MGIVVAESVAWQQASSCLRDDVDVLPRQNLHHIARTLAGGVDALKRDLVLGDGTPHPQHPRELRLHDVLVHVP